MALVINSNVASLAAQRSLTETQKESSVSLERLSSGLRINSAKDDAAGLAISNRLSAQINGLSAAMRNSNDGISMLQTAEGAMSEITDNLQRMRELAVQAANGTNQASDRTALNAELTQLVAEIERVADGTTFNGNTLFDGNFTANIQVGADNAVNDSTNRVNLGSAGFINAQTATLGTGSTTSGGTVSQALTAGTTVAAVGAGEIEVNGTSIGAVALGGNGSYAQNVANAVMAADSDITATVGTSTLDIGDFTAITDAGTTDVDIKINDVVIVEAAGSLPAVQLQAALDGKESELAALGITYTGTAGGTVANSDNLVFERTDGGNIVFDVDTTVVASAGGFSLADSDLTTGTGSNIVRGFGEVTLSSDFAIVIEAGTAADALKIGAPSANISTYDASTTASTDLASISLTSEANAQVALTSIDTALDSVNAARANMGAMFNRLDSVSSNLASTIESYTAANSRVQDADFAVESANLARTQVLQQAGISVLAQANALPQQVLALLQ